MTYLMRLVLLACLRARATDLHIEPKEGWFQLRMRVDGVMVDAARVPEEIGHALVGIVKICSDIDPSQKSTIQEGHFSCRSPVGPPRPVINTRGGWTSASASRRRCTARSSCCASSTPPLARPGSPTCGCPPTSRATSAGRSQQEAGDGPRLRADRLGQDQHALRADPQPRR